MSLKSIAVLGASLALIPASSASAGSLSTANVCEYSIYPGYWFDHTIELTGAASPRPVAPGSGVALTGTSARARLPEWVVEYATNFQLFRPGENSVSARVWMAIAADGTPQGSQVLSAETVARTIVTVGDAGEYVSSTPIDVTVPLADTTWAAPSSDGTLGWRQAGPGTLPAVPTATGSGTVSPTGSLFIAARLGDALGALIDCQPGTELPGRRIFAAATAGAFETVPVSSGAPAIIAAPKLKAPALSLRTTKLKRTGRRIGVALACAGAPCKGTVTAKYAGGTAAKSVQYSLAAGGRRTYKLTLSAKALKSLEQQSLLINVKVTAAGGKTESKKLRLKK